MGRGPQPARSAGKHHLMAHYWAGLQPIIARIKPQNHGIRRATCRPGASATGRAPTVTRQGPSRHGDHHSDGREAALDENIEGAVWRSTTQKGRRPHRRGGHHTRLPGAVALTLPFRAFCVTALTGR